MGVSVRRLRDSSLLILVSIVLAAAWVLTMFGAASALAGTWNLKTVDSTGGLGSFTSLALDASGNPRISYYDEANGDLKYAWSDDGGATWPSVNIKTVDSAGIVGQMTSLALDASGNPCISYFDWTNNHLKYAWSDDGGKTWPTGNIKTVDSTGNTGQYASLALDASGNPRISYFDETNKDLKYAWSDDGGNTWPAGKIKTVDSTGYTGYYTSLALDASGNPRISYYDVTNYDLKYAWSDDGGNTWPAGKIKTVDSTGTVGQYTSLALDASGNPRISYFDVTNKDLKYAWSGDKGVTWPAGNIKTVDSTGDTGYCSSLALDTSGNPCVSYYDYTNGDLKYAWSDDGGATWPAANIMTLDSIGSVGLWTSLAMDTSGNPRISYQDGSNTELKYAYLQTTPAVQTKTASAVTNSGTTLNGKTITTGGGNCDQRGFSYRKKGDATWTEWSETGSFGAGNFNHPITGLAAGTTYDFKARAHNAEGWGEGSVLTFTTNSASSTWYLAEGTTAWGFSAYISITNPNDHDVMVAVTYMPTDGAVANEDVLLPASSQTTLTNDHLLQVMGGNKDFSTRVEAKDGSTIAVDRTMNWTGPGAPSEEAHSSIGVTAPATTWYLPEGSSAWGFECWLLIQNPNSSKATCEVTYMIEGVGPVKKTKEVPANSRQTYNMAEDIRNADASIKVVSDLPVIPERAMYRNSRREGHDSIGTTTPATDYYLAEGATGYNVGYITYVLIQNPQGSPTDVKINYLTGSGQVEGPSFQMPANSRKTVKVNDQLPANTDVSTHVHGSAPIIAERAMYWDNGTGEACHDSIGMDSAHKTFYLPDGETSNGRETWTLVQNPNGTDVTVDITYMTPNGTGNVTKTETIGANSRRTFNMAEHSGLNGRAAITVKSLTPAKKIMVERAMYWNSRGAGTDTIGGYGD